MDTSRIDREVKALQKRLNKYGKYKGMFLNQKYDELMNYVENIRGRIIENDTDLSPQKVSGLVRRLQGIVRSEVPKYFDVYNAEEDVIESVAETTIEFKESGIKNIVNINAVNIILSLRKEVEPPKSEEYNPVDVPQEEVRYQSTEVLDNVLRRLYKYHWGLFVELRNDILESINRLGQDTVAQIFEQNAQQYNTTGDMKYDEAKGLYEDIGMWGLMDLEDNKYYTSELDYYESEE